MLDGRAENCGERSEDKLWERGHFRPSRNRSLTHKKKEQFMARTKLEKCIEVQHHTDFLPKNSKHDTHCGVSWGFFQLVLKPLVLSYKTLIFASLKIFCVFHLSFSSLKCNGPTVNISEVHQTGENGKQRCGGLCWQCTALHCSSITEHLLVVLQ